MLDVPLDRAVWNDDCLLLLSLLQPYTVVRPVQHGSAQVLQTRETTETSYGEYIAPVPFWYLREGLLCSEVTTDAMTAYSRRKIELFWRESHQMINEEARMRDLNI